MSKLLRIAAALAAVCMGAAAPAAPALEPSRLAGFIDLYAPKSGKDYELRMATYLGETIRSRQIIRRHGDWVRVEHFRGDELQGVQRIHIPTGVVVGRSERREGDIEGLAIRAPDRLAREGIDYTSRQTRRSWKVAGQKCRIWEIYRGVEAGYTTFTRFGCLTRDGIEVARWTTGRTGSDLGERTTGYYLYRGKMDEADVRPSAASLDISGWLGAGPTGTLATRADHEVVLRAEGSPERLTLRRHGGWTYSEAVNEDGSRDIFADREDGVTVSARIGAGGAPESYTARRGPRPEALPEVRLQEPGATVLGRQCDWYDVMPGAADIGRYECRTADGAVLIIRKSSRGRETILTATEVSSRPLATEDVLPPAWLRDLTRWGVAD